MTTTNSTLLLKGGMTITPSPTSLCNSGDPLISAPFTESITVDAQDTKILALNVNTPVVIDLTSCPNVNALEIKCDQKIDVIITTASGTAQVIPVDSFMAWMCASVPITALSLVRQAGIITNVRIVLAEKATS